MSQTAPTAPSPGSPPAVPQLAKGKPRMQEFGLIIVILLLCLFLWLASGNATITLSAKEVPGPNGQTITLPFRQVQENGFLRTENIFNSILLVMSWMAIMAIGQTIVIISGGIDISVGSIMGLSGFVTALVLLKFSPDAPAYIVVPVGVLLPIAVGALCGFINGSLVVGLRMHPFIVSLATLSIFRWAPEKLGKFFGASQPFGDQPLPHNFTDNFIAWNFIYPTYGGQKTESIAVVPILFMVLGLVLGWLYLRHSVWGRETYAVGGNEEAARFSGIRVPWVKMRVYILSGLTAGVAGMLICGYYKSAATNIGTGYELNVIAYAVVGGASLTGGRGTALGAVLGTLVLTLIEDGIYVLGSLNLGFTRIAVEKEDTRLIMGIAIIIAVAIDQFSMYLQSRRSARLRTAH
jgi:ribose/xylose/arabinose/galactoside ABC-type transport system permease subunit